MLTITAIALVVALTGYADAAMTAISIYLTIVSAYLVASFVAGSRLTSSQFAITGVLFISAASFFAYVSVGCILRQDFYASMLGQIQTNSTIYVSRYLALMMGVTQALGIVASLKFMWDVRHPKS